MTGEKEFFKKTSLLSCMTGISYGKQVGKLLFPDLPDQLPFLALTGRSPIYARVTAIHSVRRTFTCSHAVLHTVAASGSHDMFRDNPRHTIPSCCIPPGNTVRP